MRIINVIEVQDSDVKSVKSFIVHDEQNMFEVVKAAEECFIQTIKNNYGDMSEDSINKYIEDGSFFWGHYTVSLVWSYSN